MIITNACVHLRLVYTDDFPVLVSRSITFTTSCSSNSPFLPSPIIPSFAMSHLLLPPSLPPILYHINHWQTCFYSFLRIGGLIQALLLLPVLWIDILSSTILQVMLMWLWLWLQLCMHLYVCARVCVCVYGCMCVCGCVCVWIYMYVYVSVSVCARVSVYAFSTISASLQVTTSSHHIPSHSHTQLSPYHWNRVTASTSWTSLRSL